MIFAEWKPLDEIIDKIKSHKRVLLVGCATCVAECAAGGEKEVETLAPLLRMALTKHSHSIEIVTDTLEKQCEWEFVEQLADKATDVDAILSIACGIGIQALAERYMFHLSCPRISDDFRRRLEYLRDSVEEYRLDGMICEKLKFCDLWGGESFIFRRDSKTSGLPLLALERELYGGSEGQIKTRVQAFIERIGKI